MKKILIALTLVLSFFGINKVNANTVQITHSDVVSSDCFWYYSDYNYIKQLGYDEQLQEIYRLLIDEYNNNYSSYPYYYLMFVVRDKNNCNTASNFSSIGSINGYLNLFSEIPTFNLDPGRRGYGDVVLHSSYIVSSQVYNFPTVVTGFDINNLLSSSGYNPMFYFISNFDFINDTEHTYIISGNSNFTINPGDIIEPYYSSDNAFQINYTEINLNDYAYVILSLKNYQQNSFSTTIQVKGQFCPTPVYSLGTESSEEMFGTNVKDVCTPYYESYTPYSLNYYSDYLEKFAMLYVKAYDTSRDNYIKVDNRLFDITYVTEEEKDNPVVHYQGNIIPTIPFDDLPSTSIQNTQLGYVPDYGSSFSFSDIFTHPLEFLKDVWSTIATFFTLITSFIALMPVELRGFLFASFTLGIALGIIKIIL